MSKQESKQPNYRQDNVRYRIFDFVFKKQSKTFLFTV